MGKTPKKKTPAAPARGRKKGAGKAFHTRLAGTDVAMRVCLACDRAFRSGGPGTRICPKCRARQEIAADRPPVRIAHPNSHRDSHGPPNAPD